MSPLGELVWPLGVKRGFSRKVQGVECGRTLTGETVEGAQMWKMM